jgi:histidyl-tRNA synthetase
MSKVGIPKGMRDFSPEEVAKRSYIFDTIRMAFKKYGFQAIETPSMENLQTLTGKYGAEGDQLIFKVLNSGDYLAKTSEQNLTTKNSKALTSEIAEKALRYDLTVPFARYVVMHQNDITFPFKRYQIQPVWRADRPQRGRYREFYQCDADIVGSDALINEVELILLYDEVFSKLGLSDFDIKINNRKILAGIAEIIGKPDLIIDLTVAIDKIDKIGLDGVEKELIEKGFSPADLEKLNPVLKLSGNHEAKINSLKTILKNSEIGLKGIAELSNIFELLAKFKIKNAKVVFDLTLARGLNYYTGAIFEVSTNQVQMGSIGGGGRYDDLTGLFGLKDLTGVGISFGADRIYDVLHELNLFPIAIQSDLTVLITHFDEAAFTFGFEILQALRAANIASEIYPNVVKMQKQMKYANDRGATNVIVIGEEEIKTGLLSLKNMESGLQEKYTLQDLIKKLS